MSDANSELDRIMREQGLSCGDVARELDVLLETVQHWVAADRNERLPMPESELRLLQYALMTENRRYFLF